MSEPRNARARLSEGEKLALEFGEWIERWRDDTAGRQKRAKEIFEELESKSPEELRLAAAFWQQKSESLLEFINLSERYTKALAPFADEGWKTLEADLQLGKTRKARVGSRYVDDAEPVARRLFAEGAGWKDLYRVLRSDPSFSRRLPGDEAIRKQLTKRNVRPANGTTA